MPQGVPKPFPDGFQEDKVRDGGQNIGSPVDMLVDTVARMQKDLSMLREENLTKNTSHLTGDTGSPAGGAHDDESAAVRRNY